MAMTESRTNHGLVDGDTIERDAVLMPIVQGVAGEQVYLTRAMLDLARSGKVTEQPEAVAELIGKQELLAERTPELLREHPDLPASIVAAITELIAYQHKALEIINASSNGASGSTAERLIETAGMLRSFALKVSFACLNHIIDEHIVADGKITREQLQDLFDLSKPV